MFLKFLINYCVRWMFCTLDCQNVKKAKKGVSFFSNLFTFIRISISCLCFFQLKWQRSACTLQLIPRYTWWMCAMWWKQRWSDWIRKENNTFRYYCSSFLHGNFSFWIYAVLWLIPSFYFRQLLSSNLRPDDDDEIKNDHIFNYSLENIKKEVRRASKLVSILCTIIFYVVVDLRLIQCDFFSFLFVV